LPAIPPHPRRREEQSLEAALLLTVTVWSLLAGLPRLRSAALGPDGSLLLAFVSALVLVLAFRRVGPPPRGRAAASCCVGWLAGFVAGAAGLALLGGWLAPAGAVAAQAPRVSLPFAIAVVLAAPALEELLYREQLFDAVRRVLGRVAAVACTSLLFALPHLRRPLVLATFAVGLGLALLRARGAPVALCIGFHSGLNGAAVLWGPAFARNAPALATVALLGGIAAAAPAVATAAERPWRGTLEVAPLAPGTPPLSLAGAGVATVNGSGGPFPLVSLQLAGGITGSLKVPVTDPELSALLPSVRATFALGSGRLSPFWPGLGPGAIQLDRRALAVRGLVRLCSFVADCDGGLRIPLSAGGGTRALGVGGAWTVGGYGAQRISLEAAPWTVATATALVTTAAGSSIAIPSFGWLHGPYSFESSAALTGGEVSLVTPMRLASLDGRRLASFTRLTLRFIPEPRSLPMLLAGIAFVLASTRRSIRSAHRPGPAGRSACPRSSIRSTAGSSHCCSRSQPHCSAASSEARSRRPPGGSSSSSPASSKFPAAV